jgi:hypothetical protein
MASAITNGFGDLFARENPRKFLFLEPNPLIDGMIAKIAE